MEFGSNTSILQRPEQNSARPDLTVAESIWNISQDSPEKLALVSEHLTASYQDIISSANALAEVLLERHIHSGQVIGVATDDGVLMIVAALAIWRINCAYLPLDPAGPVERIRLMLNEARVEIVLAEQWQRSVLDKQLSQDVVTLPERSHITSRTRRCDRDDLGWACPPDGLAYVMYTSGSTGKPKGVGITHANLWNLVNWYRFAFDVKSEDRATQFAALTFDAAILESWPILAAGASLHILDQSIALSPDKLRDYVVSAGMTLCFAVTPIAEALMRLTWPEQTRLRYLLTGADKLQTFAPSTLPFTVVNNYGPTECTVLATSGVVATDLGAEGAPSIGKAIAGVAVHIVDPDLNLVPKGMPGQIAISGLGVGTGYLANPELTNERFVNTPWRLNSRVYLTGDIGRELENGELEFCGRIDDQIKIRGYRIEPSEITGALRTHPAVRQSVVVAFGDGPGTNLAAYLVLQKTVDADELRCYLADRLPKYMIPDCFIRMTELPMKSGGKIDRSALPIPNAANCMDVSATSDAVEHEIQARIGDILSQVLGGYRPAPHDNFFRVGGHSLLAAQVITKIARAFGVQLSLRTVFERPTIVGLADEIEKLMLEDLALTSNTEPAQAKA